MRKLWASLLWLKVTSLAAAPPAQPHGDQIFTYVQAEQLEYRIANNGSDTLAWDVRGWVGGDYNRIWFKTQGDDGIDGPVEKRSAAPIQPLGDALLGPGRRGPL